MKKTKILFLDTNDEIGGVFTVLASLLEGLDRKRFAITVACEKQGKPEKEFAKIDGIRVVGCRFGTKPEGVAGTGFGSKIFDLLRLPLLAWAVLRLCALVVFSGIDIIYTSDKIRTMLVAALVKSLTGRKLVYHIHGMCVPSRLNSMALKKSETILANSAATKKDFIRLLGPDMERIAVVHNGISADVSIDGPDLRDGLGIGPDAVVVGIFSRLTPNKGQEEFVRAAALVAAAAPETRFVVAGDAAIYDGNENFREKLETLARELGIEEKIHFLGFCSDMDSVYRTVDVAVNAAWEEAFGMVVIEPMAYCRPVVGTDSGGIPEIIEHGRTGLLVPPRDPESLGRAILELVQDEEKRRTIGRAARRTVEDRFSIEAQVEKVEGILVQSGSR